MLIIDGSSGEGGGQVLRTALGLSSAVGVPFTIHGIRAGRARPGLLRQHLACVRAAAAIARAEVEGDSLGATRLVFRPSGFQGGDHRVVIGSAGSAMLVVQAVLPALLVGQAPSRLIVEGGTHNPSAPPFDFLDRCFVPLLRRMGARVQLTLERPGFFPAGGGRVVLEVEPAPLSPLVLRERGAVLRRHARAVVSGLDLVIAQRELNVLGERLRLSAEEREIVDVPNPVGPGNAVVLEIECEGVTEVFTGIGERSVPGPVVARRVADDAEAWLARGLPVGPYLADQLLVPMVLAPGGAYRTQYLSSHARTNMEGVARFLPVVVAEARLETGGVEVTVTGA